MGSTFCSILLRVPVVCAHESACRGSCAVGVMASYHAYAPAAPEADGDVLDDEEEEEDSDQDGAEVPQPSGFAATCGPLGWRPSPPPQGVRRGRPPNSGARGPRLSYEQLSALFHVTVTEAAATLGVCRTTLKTACRHYGIQRWPKRKAPERRGAQDKGAMPPPSAKPKTTRAPKSEAPVALKVQSGVPSLMDVVCRGAEELVKTRACPWMTV